MHGVFSEKNVKIKYFVNFRHQFWHSLENMIDDYFEGVRLRYLYFFHFFGNFVLKSPCVSLQFWSFLEQMKINYFGRRR